MATQQQQFSMRSSVARSVSTDLHHIAQQGHILPCLLSSLMWCHCRLAFTFDSKLGFRSPVINYTRKCTVPSTTDMHNGLTPNSSIYSNYQVPSGWAPTDTAPNVSQSVCNSDMPNNATYTRFLWMCNYYISQVYRISVLLYFWAL